MTTGTDKRTRIACTGLSGFVGTAVARRLAGRFALLDLYHRAPASSDLSAAATQLRPEAVTAGVEAAREWGAAALINIAAAADVDACERERGDRGGNVYQANVAVPRDLASACTTAGLRFVHVSTDYVFDGEAGPYRESDTPTQAVNWYGQTKLEGERAVQQASPAAVLARLSLPYGEPHPRKRDIVRLVRSRLDAGQTFNGAVDQFITPTWLDDVADGLAALATGTGSGVYHLAGATVLSPFEAALIVARTFDLDEGLVRPATSATLAQAGRAPRPRITALLSARLEHELGPAFRPKGFAEGIGMLLGRPD